MSEDNNIRDNFNSNSRQRQYMDPASELYNSFVIKIEGEVNAQMASRVTAQLQQLEKMDPTKTIEIQIDSPGGSVVAGLSIYDVAVNKIKNPIRTVGLGMQASMGSIFMAMGDERIMTKNATLMIHQIAGGSQGKASAMAISSDYAENLHETLKSIYVERIGLKHEFWDRVLEHDTFLSAEQAYKMGFITRIADTAKKSPFAGEAVRNRTTSESFASAVNSASDKAAEAWIKTASKHALLTELNNVSADGSVSGRYRADMVLKLSQLPEMWTEGKKVLEAQKTAANSNTKNGAKNAKTAKVG